VLEQMNWVCSNVITLAMQLSSAQDLPAPEVMRQRISSLLDNMHQRAQQVSIPAEDVLEAKYALVAFIDEQLLKSRWAGVTDWMARPLQLIHFNENTAGEGFFARLQALMQQPNRVHVVQIYYYCMALGFEGQYAVSGGNQGLQTVLNQTRQLIGTYYPASDVVSPHGVPTRSLGQAVRRNVPVVAIALGVLGLAILIFFILDVLVESNADDAVEQMRSGVAPLSLDTGMS
jgi:type VI secretion system protein ImpK